uniref:ZP domain-containing protein n=1 Tax=Panagrolaimus superbus TaxID=310955 RepID=A0A914YFR7_9BILA
MPELTYDANLNLVYAQSKVFKFSDSNKMHFNCLLYICPKNDVMCKNSVPPACGAGKKARGKRFSSLRNGVHELMLNSSTPFRQFRDLQRNPIQIQMQLLNEKAEKEMEEERLKDEPIVEDESEALLLPPEQPRISPIIHYERSVRDIQSFSIAWVLLARKYAKIFKIINIT